MDKSINAHRSSPLTIASWVWFEGTGALKEGSPVCYNTDYGVATEVDAGRHNRVEVPAAASLDFAGVAARDYSAKAGGQLIEIYLPGSRGVMVNIDTDTDTTLNTTLLTFCSEGTAGEIGTFVAGTVDGRGSARARQTTTDGTKCQADLLEGALAVGIA